MKSTKQRSTIKTTAMAIGTIMLLGTLGAAPAFAKACKNVHLQVNNQSGQIIKIIDVDYWDDESEKWRSLPIANEQIQNNRLWQENRNLARVNRQDVRIRVEYKTPKKWNRVLKRWKWNRGKKSVLSGFKKCTRNSAFVVNVR